MAKSKNVLLTSVIIVMTIIAIVMGGCGQKPENVPAEGSDISVETEESSAELPEETPTPAAPEKESEDTPVSTEEEVVLTSESYMAELTQGDCLEFKFSDYNPDYKLGNRVTLSITMESVGMFNGCVGASVGSSYEWQQEEYDFEAGCHTVTWTVTPSVDSAQLNLWYAESAPVGVISIEVNVEEVEPAVIGKLATFTEQDSLEFTLSEYNSLYKVGNLVKISVVLESDGDFNGSIGASVGKDYTWNQKEFKYDEGGRYTLSWTVKPSSDYANIGIWWVGGTSVGIHSITVTILEEEIGIHGDYITMFTDDGNFEFVPSLINPSFKFGDKIRITATLESDGEFTGSMGTSVGGNYEWTQTEYESDTGISTWVLDVSPAIDMVQLGIWYIGGTAVGVVDIDIEILDWGYQHVDVKGLIYTSTEKNDVYTFMPSDYCDFEDGDIITIRVELDSNEVYNGCISVNDINGTSRSTNYSSNGGTVICELVVEASTKEEAKIEFWWMNTKVALNSITVTKGGTIIDTNDDDTFYPNEMRKFRTAANYCDYKQGDTVTVSVTLSGDGYFKGSVGMSGTSWVQSDFESADGSPVTCTIKVPSAVSETNDIQIGVWWSEGSFVHIDNITVTKEDKAPDEDDNKPGEDDRIDTSDWQLAFNGFGTDWSGWNSVNGSTGTLEFSAKIKDIMDVNHFTDISEFGGFIFQIWHVDSRYNGRSYTYRLDINGATFKEGTGIIDCSQYNSTDVVQLSMSDYSFSPEDEISCVISVSDAAEPEEPEDAIYTFTYEKWAVDGADAFTFSPRKYGDFETGDTIIITVDFESISGQYNGTLGVSDANNDWQAAGEQKDTSSQWILEVPNASRNNDAQVQMWWMDTGASAKITNITVTKKEEEVKKPIYTFNQAENYPFTPSDYGTFETGDTIVITVTFDASSNQFNGTIGTNDATGNWVSASQQSGTQWTFEVPNANKDSGGEIQMWWMDTGVTAAITDITVAKKEEEVKKPIYTFSQAENYPFTPSDYGTFETGDTIVITVTFDASSSQFNGTIGTNDATGNWVSATQQSGTQWSFEVPNANKDSSGEIQMWWMDTGVTAAITDITVTKKVPIHVFNQAENFAFTPSDYGTFETGDTIIITVDFNASSDQFNGTIGTNDATGNWVSATQQSGTQWTFEVPNANKDSGGEIQMWWMDTGVTATITDITVTKVKAPIYTFNQAENYPFTPGNYGTFETGDTIVITVTFDASSSQFNGTIGTNDATGNWVSATQQSGTQWTFEVPNANKDSGGEIQMWWMDTGVTATITDITVTKKETTRTAKLSVMSQINNEGGKHPAPMPDSSEPDEGADNIPTVSGGNAVISETGNTDTVSGNDAAIAENG